MASIEPSPPAFDLASEEQGICQKDEVNTEIKPGKFEAIPGYKINNILRSSFVFTVCRVVGDSLAPQRCRLGPLAPSETDQSPLAPLAPPSFKIYFRREYKYSEERKYNYRTNR